MEARSFGATPESPRRPQHLPSSSPRPAPGVTVSPSTDERRVLMTVDVVKGPSGFGFTLAETEHGQVIKDVVDAERCHHIIPGDILIAVNNLTVRDWSHEDVVNVLRACRTRRPARLTLMTSRRDALQQPPRDVSPVRLPASNRVQSRPTNAMASPVPAAHPPQQRVNYNQLYRKLYSPAPGVQGSVPNSPLPAFKVNSPDVRRVTARDLGDRPPTTQLVTSNGCAGAQPDVVLPGGSSSSRVTPSTPEVVGASSAMTGRLAVARRREQPRRSLPAQPVSVDLLSPLMPRRASRESQSSLNFSGTPDFIPASAYLDDDDRRRRASGRPSADRELAALALDDSGWPRNDDVFMSSATRTAGLNGQPTSRDGCSIQSFDADDAASSPSTDSLRNGPVNGLPVTSSSADRRTPATFIGAGQESCNRYNAREAALQSAAAVRHPPTVEQQQQQQQRHRSQSALGDAIRTNKGQHRTGPGRLSIDGTYEERAPATEKNGFYSTGSLDRRNTKQTEPEPAQPLANNAAVNSTSATVNGRAAEVVGATDDQVAVGASSYLYQVELHRGSRGFGFAIRGGKEFSAMPITVLNIASGGSAHMDGRLRNEDEVVSINGVSTDGMTHSEAVELIQNSPSPLQLVMRKTTTIGQPGQLLNHGRTPRQRHYLRSPMTVAQRMASPSRGAIAVPPVSTPPAYRRPTDPTDVAIVTRS